MENRAFIAPRSMLERKPRHGAPCNGCGLCCVATKCDLGKHLFGDSQGACPALVRTGAHTYGCGVVMYVDDPGLREAAKLLLRVGEGCDARFNGEWVNHQYHRDCDKKDSERKEQIGAARAAWGA